MQLTRLYQPHNPKFWLMLALNALSTVLAWVSRSFELSWFMAALVVVFALGNAVLGLVLMVDLIKTPSSAASGQNTGNTSNEKTR